MKHRFHPIPVAVRNRCIALAVLATLLAGHAFAAPYEPRSDETVLARLPAAELNERNGLAQRAAALKTDPARHTLRAALAWDYIELHSQTGDPRYLGFAEATLGEHADTPELQLAAAHLLQARHAFSEAIVALQAIVARTPTQRRAWSMLAAVAEVVGDYDLARNACARLIVLGDNIGTRGCAASIASMTGQSEAALAQLEDALRQARDEDTQVLGWAHVVAGEIAQRLGKTIAAEKHLSAAVAIAADLYPVIAYADLLLDLGRDREALALLADQPESDAVLLRRAIAAQRLGAPDAAALAERIGQRLDTLRWRRDTRHAREQAIYALHIDKDATAALAAAQQNWQLQKESIDARLLLHAAVASGRPDAAQPVLDWMRETRSDDRRLHSLRARLQL